MMGKAAVKLSESIKIIIDTITLKTCEILINFYVYDGVDKSVKNNLNYST